MSHRQVVLLLAACVLFGACDDDDDPTGTGGTATIRVVNASPTNPTVALAQGDNTLASAVAFGTGSNCVELPGGRHVLTFSAGGTNLASTGGFTFEGGTSYTVVLSGGATTAATVFTDEFTAPAAGSTTIRFLNATGTAGDIYLTTADGAIAGDPTVSELAAGMVTPWVAYPNTNVRARLFNLNTTETARSDVTFTAPASGAATVVFTAAAEEGGPTGFLVEPCP